MKKPSLGELMTFANKILFVLLIVTSFISARQIDTFYGIIEVDEPVLLELIENPTFQRLKKIHQYGVAYYTTHKEEYNRYDHSVGVFAILREKGASLEEQIAGLLHDVSHTVFSHVGDWVFGKENQEEDYQNSIHLRFLKESGLAEILAKHGYTPEKLLPKNAYFPALEAPLPNLCADRIDYNIQGAYYRGFITYEEAKAIFKDLQFVDHKWVSTKPHLMKKLASFSLFMTQTCWGGPHNYLTSRWLADAIIRAIELKALSYKDLHFGTDQKVWDILSNHKDPFIQEKMNKVLKAQKYFTLADYDEADYIVQSKFRGIDPLIKTGNRCLRLTDKDPKLSQEYHKVKQKVQTGWPVSLK